MSGEKFVMANIARMSAESHEPHEPRSLQIKKANSTFNSEIYVLLPATCFFKKKIFEIKRLSFFCLHLHTAMFR